MDKIFQLFVNFLKKLFSDQGEVSSKRVVGFGAFLLIAAAVIVNLCGGPIIAQALLWALVTIIGACFGLNALINIKEIENKDNGGSK